MQPPIPNGPVHTDADLPSRDLVEAVVPRRPIGRLAIGTGPFNAAAMVVLVAISTFVVMASGTVPGTEPARVEAAPERTSPFGRPPGHLGFTDDDTVTPESTTTTAPPTTTTLAVTTTTAPARLTTLHRTAPPTTAAPIRCTSFTSQPDAQRWFEATRAISAGLDGDGDGLACEDLPGRPAAAPPAVTPKAVAKTYLLRPDTRLYGVHTPQAPLAAEVDAFALSAGKAPNMVMFFKNFGDPFPAQAIADSWAGGKLPMVSFEPIFKNSTNGQPKLADITKGVYDDILTSWATAAAAQGLTFVMRFAQEMNGNWYSWSDGRKGNAAGDFIPAWRHVRDIFDAAGADDIIWTWSVNRVDNLHDKTLARVYPGDDYVDWVGISGYHRSTTPGVAPSFDATFARSLAEIKKVAPKKLVVLTEVGAGTGEADRVTWINDFFERLLEHPEIIGFSWFNDFKDGGDWRIGYSTRTEAAFAAGVANSRYGSLTP